MILLRAKDVEFDVTYVNLREKPDWFLEISPHGKVPVLKVGDDILFESSAIAEFLDEMVPPRLHPEDPIARAKNRAWTDFTPTFAGALSKIHYAKTREDMEAAVADAPTVLTKVEAALAGRGNNGPFFNGPDMSLVDAAYAPFLQRYLLIDEGLKNDVLKDFPLIRAWAETLMADERVTGAVPDNFEDEFIGNLHRRDLYAREFFDNTIAAE
ncbi:MAG: glutathione S-transferase family protein [Rhodospirillaceae bacterium]|nr:glutathione S-transferase family protein [Rhodospirillaceae bacterium]MBT3929851.1 glutathione S-transferase family protein [Rhodospirillaceae bacterium]